LIQDQIKKSIKENVIEPANFILHESKTFEAKEAIQALNVVKNFLEHVFGRTPFREN